MGLGLCGLAFALALLCTWRSVVAGLGVVCTAGYLFGIVRAHYPDTFSHFIFDSAVFGFYISFFGSGGLKKVLDPQQLAMQRWTFMLIGWAVLMFLLPMQHPLIQLVGLRGNAYLLPFLLVGASLTREDAKGLAMWLAALNHVAFAFAIAEYFLDVRTFFPKNEVTEIIYRSGDVAGGALRIPATFANAHSYGGAMMITLPWMLGAWIQPRMVDWQRFFLISGTAMAMIGIFLCAARLPLILLAVVAIVATFSGHLRGTVWLVWSLLIVGVAYLVSNEERMQRFFSLTDTDLVLERIDGSVNKNFLELLVDYPFGNGIGAGGTSIPFFLHEYVRNPVAIENEYARILLEQGLAGLALWIVFIFWFLTRRPVDPRDSWQFGKTLLWCLTLAIFATAVIGIGLMTSIPGSTLFFLGIGFVNAPPKLVKRLRPNDRAADSEAIVPATAITGTLRTP